MPSNHLILCRPLLLPSIFSSIRVFSNESVLCIRWPKYWSFSFSISPSNEYSGLISFRMDWLDPLVVQGTLKSLPQHHSSKASILCVQLSLQAKSHIHTWLLKKTIALLPRSKHLLILWLQSPSSVILEPPKIVSHCFVSPSVCPEVMGPDAMILVFWMLHFKPTVSLSSFTFIKKLLSSSSLSAIGWWHLHIWGYWYFSRQSWFQLVLLPAQRFSWCTLHIS